MSERGYDFDNPYGFTRADLDRILMEFTKGTVHFDSGDDAIIAWVIRDWQRVVEPKANVCECCGGSRIGPVNSNFAGKPCPVCR